jgi:hypothetical protein
VGDGKREVGDEKNKNIEVKLKDKLLPFAFSILLFTFAF